MPTTIGAGVDTVYSWLKMSVHGLVGGCALVFALGEAGYVLQTKFSSKATDLKASKEAPEEEGDRNTRNSDHETDSFGENDKKQQ